MTELIGFMGLLGLGCSLLGLILFFKIWGMTNDISKIKELLESLLGPLRVQLELISGLSIKDGDLSLHVVKKESPSNKDLSWTTRYGISGNYSDSLLCCFDSTLADPELTKGYGEASKRFRNLNNKKQCGI